jgi:hypothetical protein
MVDAAALKAPTAFQSAYSGRTGMPESLKRSQDEVTFAAEKLWAVTKHILYAVGREPAIRMCTSLRALCGQSGVVAT